MSDIPSAANKVQIEATLDRKPVSQDLLQIMGGSINYLLDQFSTFGFQYQLFTANGSWVAPANTTSVILFGCGGGGSGIANRYTSIQATIEGGLGAKSQWNIQAVTPGQTYTILIGAGGAAVTQTTTGTTNGNNGASTFFKLGGTTLQEFVGGVGGYYFNNITLLRSFQANSANFIAGTSNIFLDGFSNAYVVSGGGAGPFGNGGNAGLLANGTDAGANTGAGGGASASFLATTSGAGGSGLLYVIWF